MATYGGHVGRHVNEAVARGVVQDVASPAAQLGVSFFLRCRYEEFFWILNPLVQKGCVKLASI